MAASGPRADPVHPDLPPFQPSALPPFRPSDLPTSRPPDLPPFRPYPTLTVAFRSSLPHPTIRPRIATTKARTTTQYITCR